MTKEIKYFFFIIIITCCIGFSFTITLTQIGFLKFGSPIFMIFYALSGYSPTIAGILTVKKYYSKDKLIVFLKNCINIKKGIKEYIYVLSTIIIIWSIPYLFIYFSKDKYILMTYPLIYLIWIFPFMIFGGGLEEIGWRGFLLPKFLNFFSPLKSSIILGIIWSLWHLPLWFINGSNQQMLNFLPFTFSCLGASLILTSIYIKTNSIWLCIFFHALDNSCSYIFKYPINIQLPISILTTLAGILILYITFKIIH